jgi:lipopolysaccharide/colanic/teichoic acid biosynthesis glycosyltransferase
VVDLGLATGLILVTLPMMLLAATGSAISLRAWPFFTQDRVGRGGELFRFVKIRTLPVHTPRYTDKHQLKAAEIPRFCAMLRRLHLDELPQLFLVVRGRMSMVGPRPEMAWLHEQMPDEFARARTSIRPGATGLWQVSEACADLIHASPDYDLFYLNHRSLRLDLWVLGRTTKKMLGVGGRVTLATVPAWAAPATPDTASEPVDSAVAFSAASGR